MASYPAAEGERQRRRRRQREPAPLRESRFDEALNAIPRPMKDLPGAETGLRAGMRLPPSMQNTVLMRRRMYGRRPRERIFSYSFGLLSPRPIIAIARIVGGMATHATGMAHPRRTTLATMRRSRSESVVGYMASEMALDVHGDKTHRMSGAKAGADVCPVRGWRRATLGGAPDGGESAREVQVGDDGVLASALGGYGAERRRASPLDCASARFGMVCRIV